MSTDIERHWIRGFGWSDQPGADTFPGWCHGCGGAHRPEDCPTTQWRALTDYPDWYRAALERGDI